MTAHDTLTLPAADLPAAYERAAGMMERLYAEVPSLWDAPESLRSELFSFAFRLAEAELARERT